MFGYVMANPQELRPEQRERYLGCYCGICRAIGEQNSLASRLALNYDMVFLALLLSSLYEPAEEQSSGRCLIHPLSPRPWRRSEAIRYAADMNVALAYFEDGEITVYEKKLLTGISKVSITPYMEHIFAELQDFTHYRGGLGYLFLESKIHELLSVYLSEVLELRILSPEYCCISKSERDCIIEAKRIIDSELAFAPSCEGLARQVQISVSKLSRGFSMMYGISVHAYVIEQRLERAAGLLLESNMNIGQIAVLVGYTKPSNFSAAFKKKYGVMPKDYREASRIK